MTDNTAEIREALDNAQPAPQLAAAGDAPERRVPERPPFPAGCPVKPLGIRSTRDGKQTCYYLDVNGQLVGLEANNRHGALGMVALFGDKSNWLEEHYPQWSKPIYEGRGNNRVLVRESEIVGFDQRVAARALVEECNRRGIFTAEGKERGRGAHRHNHNGLVLHCGDKVLVSEHDVEGRIKRWTWIDPGLHAGFVYPGDGEIPRPIEEDVATDPGRKLVKLLMTWNWRRETVDVRLLAGAIAASPIGGALRWRSNVWVTGGSGTGKSTFNGLDGLLHRLFGEGMFRTGNTSSAAIRQSLLNSTVPVMIDEFEASDDNRKVTEVIELARLGSSGEKMHRGGADHNAHEFTIRSCFWFSSINIPPLEAQDRNRLAICELEPFGDNKPEPIDWKKFNAPLVGRQIQRRMIDKWDVLEPTIEKYVNRLAEAGHDMRGAKQFGTLLGCADVLLHDWGEGEFATDDGLPPDEEVNHWVDLCRPERMREVSENEADYTRCLNHLLDSQVQARGGDERVSLSSWIGDAITCVVDPMNVDGTKRDDQAARRLQEKGIKLVHAVRHPEEKTPDGKLLSPARWGTQAYDDDKQPGYLAVANSHRALEELFAGRKWQGNWGDALRRTPGSLERVKLKFGRRSAWAVLVPLYQVLDESELPAACHRLAVEEWHADQVKGEG